MTPMNGFVHIIGFKDANQSLRVTEGKYIGTVNHNEKLWDEMIGES